MPTRTSPVVAVTVALSTVTPFAVVSISTPVPPVTDADCEPFEIVTASVASMSTLATDAEEPFVALTVAFWIVTLPLSLSIATLPSLAVTEPVVSIVTSPAAVDFTETDVPASTTAVPVTLTAFAAPISTAPAVALTVPSSETVSVVPASMSALPVFASTSRRQSWQLPSR